ncbi:hypothetical protein BDV25DRAFT_154111 [Aspergillus avenaceus]|uniref:Uncharacterized protein n=1 Tax=Aspergillus avenaceus TaxID=36643 RepID=A0A5N6TWD5_ASPAV|nr:hypothetical protein BDV25DRAFT_154111 [Aspergillus avenaceus]
MRKPFPFLLFIYPILILGFCAAYILGILGICMQGGCDWFYFFFLLTLYGVARYGGIWGEMEWRGGI